MKKKGLAKGIPPRCLFLKGPLQRQRERECVCVHHAKKPKGERRVV